MNIVIVKRNKNKIDIYLRKDKEIAEELAMTNEQLFEEAKIKVTDDFNEIKNLWQDLHH